MATHRDFANLQPRDDVGESALIGQILADERILQRPFEVGDRIAPKKNVQFFVNNNQIPRNSLDGAIIERISFNRNLCPIANNYGVLEVIGWVIVLQNLPRIVFRAENFEIFK